MKKTFLTLAIAVTSYSSYAQTNTFPSGGNVGIGTTSPSILFDTQLSTGSGIQLIGRFLSGGNATGNGATIAVGSTQTHSGYITGLQTASNEGDLIFGTQTIGNYSEKIRIVGHTGNVGIGTTNPDAKLAVNGTIHAKEVKVDLTGWPDYVFKPTYNLPSLTSVKAYIDKHSHLPEMPSEQEVAKDGVNLGQMNKLLLKKVEELTLYLIKQEDRIKTLEAKLEKIDH